MKTTITKLAMLLGVTAGVLVSGGVAAQPPSQSYWFYGEELGGSYLGVDTRDITSDRLGPLHLKEENGVEVTMVDQDAPAGKAGLREHDVILSINDQRVESVEQLRRLIHEVPAGRTISIGISRDGQAMTLKAQLAERNKFSGPDQGMEFNMPPVKIPAIHIPPINMPDMDVPVNVVVIHSPVRSGLMVENLTPQLGDYFGVKSANGVLVRSVERGSRGEQAGFRAGDVIVKVNGSAVNDCSDFSRLLRERKENKVPVTVMREHKEQVLTLSLPEPRHSGRIERGCKSSLGEACEEIFSKSEELAEMMPELATAELRRLEPDMRHAQKQLEQQNGELKKEMERLKRDLRKHEREIQQQMKHWIGGADI